MYTYSCLFSLYLQKKKKKKKKKKNEERKTLTLHRKKLTGEFPYLCHIRSEGDFLPGESDIRWGGEHLTIHSHLLSHHCQLLLHPLPRTHGGN